MIFDQFPEIVFATSKVSNNNLSFVQGNPKEVLENRKKFLNSKGISLDSTIVMSVQHGSQVLNVGKNHLGKGAYQIEDALQVDVLITNKLGINLFLLTADCLPISLYDPKNKAIGLIHAGWKGLDLGIIKVIVEKMTIEFKTSPKDLVAHIGPSIGPCCYNGFPDIKQKNDPKWEAYIFQDKEGFGLDLWSFAHDQLKQSGLLTENIENSKTCTYHSGEYFSHRKFEVEKLENDYRFATVLGLK